MENWYKRILLGGVLLSAVATTGHAQEPWTSEQVIDAGIDRRELPRTAIDTENFEVGPYGGMLSIEDFSSEIVYGIRGAWHISEHFFLEGSYGMATADLTSYEEISGGAPLFSDEERDYSYYNFSLGWNLLPGEVFIFGNRAMKSDFYLIGGVGGTSFLGDDWFTVSVGAGYRLLLNDAIAWRFDVRDNIFDREAFGASQVTNNIELTTGLTFFF